MLLSDQLLIQAIQADRRREAAARRHRLAPREPAATPLAARRAPRPRVAAMLGILARSAHAHRA